MKTRRQAALWAMGAAICSTAACSTAASSDAIAPVAEVGEAAPADPWAGRELPFEPSENDRAYLGTGFVGGVAVPAETGFSQGAPVAGVRPGQALANAGLNDGDVIVELAGQRFDGPVATVIQRLREITNELPPDSWTTLAYFRKDEGVKRVDVLLGRAPPRFNLLTTPHDWLNPPYRTARRGGRHLVPNHQELWADRALALDDGGARYRDTFHRQKKVFGKRDTFLLREVVVAQRDPFIHEQLADLVARAVSRDAVHAARIAAGDQTAYDPAPPASVEAPKPPASLDEALDRIEAAITEADRIVRSANDWTDEEREFVVAHLPVFTEYSFIVGDYIYGDDDVARERANRRFVKLLARVDRATIARAAAGLSAFVQENVDRILELAAAGEEQGLRASRDTPAGRIEIWGIGNQRHKTRCAFRVDVGGNDNYLDCAGRADLEQPISVSIDATGHDVYGATSPFSQGAALAGIGLLIDITGDDQYLARQWSQGSCLAGFGALRDLAGDDIYRGLECCQGVALVGAGVLHDYAGRDTYTTQRFSQGVGFAGGVGALLDDLGDDHYASTGRYPSEYGEPGVFSGWSQGVGFGFRRVTSGGIGLLLDGRGDDVYEAGNFSQGGAYFFAWGALLDRGGHDRYIGSRYAQGFAAHQASGTFVDSGGNDRYQSHAGVAQGLSWDETCVFFRDRGGNDVYETRGFSLASSAHNGISVFIEDGGNDTYADLPGKAKSNTYHGGHSFALFVDLGGRDTYGKRPVEAWNDRVTWRHDGAYSLDLPSPEATDLSRFVQPETDQK